MTPLWDVKLLHAFRGPYACCYFYLQPCFLASRMLMAKKKMHISVREQNGRGRFLTLSARRNLARVLDIVLFRHSNFTPRTPVCMLGEMLNETLECVVRGVCS